MRAVTFYLEERVIDLVNDFSRLNKMTTSEGSAELIKAGYHIFCKTHRNIKEEERDGTNNDGIV